MLTRGNPKRHIYLRKLPSYIYVNPIDRVTVCFGLRFFEKKITSFCVNVRMSRFGRRRPARLPIRDSFRKIRFGQKIRLRGRL